VKNQQNKVNSIMSCSKHTKQKNIKKNLKKWGKNLDTRKQIKHSKGQLISKANCQAEDPSKKRTNEFVFTSMRHVFVRFLEESSARKKRFEII
jgi:hypothetical protein